MKQETSAARAARRRLALLVLLHERPRRQDELIAALDRDKLFVYTREDDAAAMRDQQERQLRRDIETLRRLKYQIPFDRDNKCYAWLNSPFGISLDPAQLTTFAIILDTFTDTTMLHAGEIQALLTFISDHLPAEQQKLLKSQHHLFTIDLREATDYRNADSETIRQIELAIQHGRQLEFAYRSPRTGKELQHVIEPRPLTFKQGHVYLHGWSLDHGQNLDFRLDYILAGSARSLPTSIVANRPPPRKYRLRYRLTPVIARNKVSQHFPDQEVEIHPDGSATVTASITDLFEARRLILGYGENCTLLEPAELIAQLQIVARHYQLYLTPE